MTPEARSKNRKWITEAVVPSLSDDSRIVMIGTVISEDCFYTGQKNLPHGKYYGIPSLMKIIILFGRNDSL